MAESFSPLKKWGIVQTFLYIFNINGGFSPLKKWGIVQIRILNNPL